MKTLLLSFLFLLFNLNGHATTKYVATDGNDNNSGTLEKPWATLQKAVNEAKPGDIVYVRGGIYYPTESVNWIPNEGAGVDGTPTARIHYLNYPGENPIFDFINCHPAGNYSSGFFLNAADYIHLRGFTVRNVKQTRDFVECWGVYAYDCSNLRFENITVNSIDGNAFRFIGAWRYPGTPPYYYPEHANYPGDSTFFINCDAYDCCDRLPRTDSNPPLGGAADGYKTNNEAGSYILFEGCRAWNCSDDGFDPSGPNKVVFNKCWAFENGYLEGDGAGFKTGALYDSDPVLRIVTNCLAVSNSTYGFFLLEYPDYNRVNARFYNNTAYKNDFGFIFSRNPDKPVVLGVWKNNISYKNTSLDFSNAYSQYTESNNSWQLVDGYPGYIQSSNAIVNDNDFVSLNQDELKQPRKADGSLPDINFLKLATGSDLIDKGTDVGLPFNGKAPDLGYSEYGVPSTSILVTGVLVTGAGSATNIATDKGTLQLSATISPTNATNKTVTWSIQNGTGQASISTSGLVTAISNGTVTARATANDGSGVYGILSITISNQVTVPTGTIVRSDGCNLITARSGNNTTETPDKAFDNLTSTKWYNFNTSGNIWIQYQFCNGASYAINSYTLTSANDMPLRDPKTVSISGSKDGVNFTLLDTKTNIVFSSRIQTLTFNFTNSTAYPYYRFDMAANTGNDGLQLSEIELIESGQTGTTPNAPSGLNASASSSSSISLNWLDNSSNETGFEIYHSTTSGSGYTLLTTTGSNVTSYSHNGLTASTTHYYKVRAANAQGYSAYTGEASATTQSGSVTSIIRSDGCSIITASTGNLSRETPAMAFDNLTSSKWYNYNTSGNIWIEYQFCSGASYAISSYTLTSANDMPLRDPRTVSISGSNDGVNFTLLDTKTNIAFTSRYQRLTFNFTNSKAYQYYRFDMAANPGNDGLQVAEIELIETGSALKSTQAVQFTDGMVTVSPNPFRDAVTIDYNLPEDSHVNLVVYDLNGRVVRQLVNENQNEGAHRIIWDALNSTGNTLHNGIYILKMESAFGTEISKIIHME